jgi:competence protein ComEC
VRDRWALVLAVAAAVGAARPSGAPLVLAAALVGAGLATRRPVLLCLGVALLTSGLAQRAHEGLRGVRAGPVVAEVTLLSDPEPAPGGVRADVRLGHRRLELRASGTVEAAVQDHLAGERLRVRGQVAPLEVDSSWLVVRHIAGRLTVDRVDPGGPPAPLAGLANRLRRALVDGARSLGPTRRSLFTGLVLGDDRAQPATLTDDFRGAGLTHLLAVSGENVAFVLALVGPLARRLRLWPRLGLVLAVVAMFALLTRFEPSVSRAAVMAAIAAITMTVGRPIARVRILALAVTTLLIVDPLLVGALGFQLSVAAALAITTLAPAVSAALPGPRWCAEPLGVTVAAQLGVAPLLLAAFGPIPLASLPANLLAVPAAGAVMVWGMTAGLVAGVAGDRAAVLLHVPTGVLLDWIAAVARRAAAAPLGQVGARGLAVAAAGLGLVVVVAPRVPARWARGLGALLAGGALYVAVVLAHAPPALRTALRPGVVRWHGQATEVVALGGGGWRSPLGAEGVLESLRVAGVGAIDLLVVVDDQVGPGVVAAVRDRHATAAVLVTGGRPPDDVPPGAIVLPSTGASLEVGALHVALVPGQDRLVVEAWPSPR